MKPVPLEVTMMKRIGELKAENARLKAEVNELADGLKLASEVGIKMADEVTRLKAEVSKHVKDRATDDVGSELIPRHLVRWWMDENARLKAEVERLKKFSDEAMAHIAKEERKSRERLDMAQAEVERLTEFTTRTIIPNEELRAEVERLTKAHSDALADFWGIHKGYFDLKAEVERLTKQNALATPRHLIASQDIKTLREQVDRLTKAGDAFSNAMDSLAIFANEEARLMARTASLAFKDARNAAKEGKQP